MKKVSLIMLVLILLLSLSGCGTKYCAVSGCPKEALSRSQYCPEHKCYNFSCKNRAIEGYSFCTQCLDHAK